MRVSETYFFLWPYDRIYLPSKLLCVHTVNLSVIVKAYQGGIRKNYTDNIPRSGVDILIINTTDSYFKHNYDQLIYSGVRSAVLLLWLPIPDRCVYVY